MRNIEVKAISLAVAACFSRNLLVILRRCCLKFFWAFAPMIICIGRTSA